MRRIVVTGANKGIGLAIVEAILREHDDTSVFLGTRNLERGRQAAEGLLEKDASWAERLEVLEIDVSEDASVARAFAEVGEKCGFDSLYAVVNNAGIGIGEASLHDVLQVNTYGVRRVCERTVPLIDPDDGRIVNVTSASGPNFVSSCSPERQRFFLDSQASWSDIVSFLEECIDLDGDGDAFAAMGLSDGDPYGLSKACGNTYTMVLARENPHLRINACTPGFIETDLTRPYAVGQGKTPADMGMKAPEEGTRSVLHLLFSELEGNGYYYGSDAKRSPLDRYRAPGEPAYTGD